MDPVVHFEMPAKDKARVKKFYKDCFGWQMNQLGAEMGNYILAGTTPVDANNMATQPGAINGGFFDYEDTELNRVPHLVISVDDLDASIEKVKAAGGTIKTDKMPIQGIGTYVTFLDSEGNVVGMLQPAPMQEDK